MRAATRGVRVRGVGVLGALGVGRSAFVDAWRAGAEGGCSVDGGARALPAFPVRDLFPEHAGVIRRLDRLSRILCSAAGLARDDGGGVRDPAGCAIAVGTDLGTLEGTEAFLLRLREKGPAWVNPMEFPNLVPNAGAGYAGIFMGLQGPSQTFCHHEVCVDDAVAWAGDLVASGAVSEALAGGGEEWGPVLGRVRTALNAPQDVLPGEGAAMLLLDDGAVPMTQRTARWLGCWAEGSGRSPLARWTGADAAERRVEQLLARAMGELDLPPTEIAAVIPGEGAAAALVAGICAAVGRSVIRVDAIERLGASSGDSALRLALAALLLQDPSLPLDRAGAPRRGSVIVVPTFARGGALRVTLMAEER